jgi:hypothetical protein
LQCFKSASATEEGGEGEEVEEGWRGERADVFRGWGRVGTPNDALDSYGKSVTEVEVADY